MRVLRIISCLAVLGALAGVASAQYGLYGAPDTLRMPTTQANYGYPVVGPVVPATSSMPTWTPAPNSYPSPPVAQPYAYPATAVNTFQPASLSPSPESIAPIEPQPEPAPRANVINQMVNESNRSPYGGCGYQSCGPTTCEPSCAPSCEMAPCSPWYASAQWLMMGRDKPNRLYTSAENGAEEHQLYEYSMDWKSGGEIRFGRRFCCGLWALEATYWMLDPMTSFTSFTIPAGTLVTPMDVQRLQFTGETGDAIFDGSPEHRVWRRSEFQNLEINLLRRDLGGMQSMPWNVEWTMGVRYFRFEDGFRFGALRAGGAWGGNGGADEAYITDNIKNSLVGFQFGFDVRSNSWHNLELFFTPQFGIYNNRIENLFQIYRGDGDIPTPTVATGTYPVRSARNVLSFLSEIDMGVRWRISPRWSAQAGYRIVVATGIGLSDAQVPQYYLVDIPEINRIDYNGELILHGAYAGISFNF
ncbi:MAG: hypothetical protein JW818_09245 [Pirellulales bacterium]|nr:hypothetical protein [Pirellulales bacterium]